MAATRFRHFLLYTEPTEELGQLLMKMGKTISEHVDAEKGPYYYLYLGKQMTVNRLKKVTGCDNIEGVAVVSSNEIEMTRSSIALAKKEHEALVKKGKIIMDILNEDNTSVDILSMADRKAVKAYKKLLEKQISICVKEVKDAKLPEADVIEVAD